MTYWVDFNNNLAGIKRPEKADFIQRRANDYFDKIGRELNAPIATALAQTTLPEVETTNNSAQNVNPTIEQSKSITNAPEPFVPTMPITGVPSAANAKHNISDPQVEKLCKYLESDKPGKVIFALKSLRKMRATEAATRILPCLTHSNPNVIRESCRTLTIIGNKDAIPAIELLLTNARPDLVREACRTLAILGNKNVIPVIEPLLTNSKSDIKYRHEKTHYRTMSAHRPAGHSACRRDNWHPEKPAPQDRHRRLGRIGLLHGAHDRSGRVQQSGNHFPRHAGSLEQPLSSGANQVCRKTNKEKPDHRHRRCNGSEQGRHQQTNHQFAGAG